MALKKKVELLSGVDCRYWRIESISVLIRKTSMEFEAPQLFYTKIIVVGYLNEAARTAGKASVTVNDFSFDASAKDFTEGYALLKTTDFFKGAVDC